MAQLQNLLTFSLFWPFLADLDMEASVDLISVLLAGKLLSFLQIHSDLALCSFKQRQTVLQNWSS